MMPQGQGLPYGVPPQQMQQHLMPQQGGPYAPGAPSGGWGGAGQFGAAPQQQQQQQQQGVEGPRLDPTQQGAPISIHPSAHPHPCHAVSWRFMGSDRQSQSVIFIQ
jgi:hypothetical protein